MYIYKYMYNLYGYMYNIYGFYICIYHITFHKAVCIRVGRTFLVCIYVTAYVWMSCTYDSCFHVRGYILMYVFYVCIFLVCIYVPAYVCLVCMIRAFMCAGTYAHEIYIHICEKKIHKNFVMSTHTNAYTHAHLDTCR